MYGDKHKWKLLFITATTSGCPYLLDWTTGLTFDEILGVLCQLINNSYCGVDHFLCLKQVQWLQTTTMPTWSTAIMQTSKWPTREKRFLDRWLAKCSGVAEVKLMPTCMVCLGVAN